MFYQPRLFLGRTQCITLQPAHAGVSGSACKSPCSIFQPQFRLLALQKGPKAVRLHWNSNVKVVAQFETWALFACISARVCMLSGIGPLWQTAGKDLVMFGMMIASSDGQLRAWCRLALALWHLHSW